MQSTRLALAAFGLLLAATPALAQLNLSGQGSSSFAPGGGGPLVQAVENGDLGQVRQLLAINTSPNDFDANGISALEIAARDGKCRIADALIQAGARLDVKDKSGATALMLAAERGNIACLDALIAANADVNATDRQGTTALIRAAANGRVDAVKRLLQAKADSAATDFTGRTAFMAADANRQRAVIAALRAAGVNN